MIGSVCMAITVPLFGSSSDEGSEALPGNRVCLTWASAWKNKPLCLNPTAAVASDFFYRSYSEWRGYSIHEMLPFHFLKRKTFIINGK